MPPAGLHRGPNIKFTRFNLQKLKYTRRRRKEESTGGKHRAETKMEEEMKSLIKVWISAVTSLSYCYFTVTKIPKGIPRLLSLFPVLYLFVVLPLNFSSLHLRGISAFFLTWLGIFKLLLFSFNKGPLISNQNSYFKFIAIASLPIKSKDDQSPPKSSTGSMNIAIKGILLALLIHTYTYMEHFNKYVVLVLYCFHVYLALEVVLAAGAATARALLGLELEPQMNEPYLSSSLQDFWGRRWNLMVSSILRPTVYRPVRSMSTRILGGERAAFVAVLAAFLVSGLMHELIFYYLTGVAPTWEVFSFFLLHGICTAVEVWLRRALTGRFRWPCALYGPMAVGFIAVTGCWLFFPPLVRNGTDEKVIGEYALLAGFLMDKGRDLAASFGYPK